MEFKQNTEPNPVVVEMKPGFVVRGPKGRDRLTPEGKREAKDTWNAVMGSIPAGEMSSATAALKAREVTDRLSKNEYTSLLKSSFEARIRNMQRQEYIAEMKTSNSGWNSVIYSAAEQWQVGKNGRGVVTNYLADQMGDVMTSIHEAQDKVGILHDSDQAIRMEQEISKQTAQLITTNDERVSEKRNLSEVVRVAAADVAGMNPTQELDAVLLNVANLTSNAPKELSHPVYSVPAVEQAVKKQRRELPKWAKEAGGRVRGFGLRAAAVLGSIGLVFGQPSPVGSEMSAQSPRPHELKMPTPPSPYLPPEVTMHMNDSYEATSPKQETVQKPEWMPGISEHKVGDIDLTESFTVTRFEGEKSVSVVISPVLQTRPDHFDPDVLETFNLAVKNREVRTQALIYNTDIQGVDSLVGHSSSVEENGKIYHMPFDFSRRIGPGEEIELSQGGKVTRLRLIEAAKISSEQFHDNSMNGWQAGPGVPDFLGFYATTGNENGHGFGFSENTKEVLGQSGGLIMVVCDDYDKSKGRENPERFKSRKLTAWEVIKKKLNS